MKLACFSIKNFKCLLDMEISLPQDSPVTFLIGLNGSGKSTLLQAFDFAGEMMRGDITGWLEKRGWKPADLPTKIHSSRKKSLIEIIIKGGDDKNSFSWYATFNPNPSFLRCTFEKLLVHDKTGPTADPFIDIQVKDGRLIINKEEQDINFSYFGSVFSQLNKKVLQEYTPLASIYNLIADTHSFDLLSPRNIRTRSRKNHTIGMSGENLAGFISSLSEQQQKNLTIKLNEFYPWIINSPIKWYKSGWKELLIGEEIGRYQADDKTYRDFYILRSSQHINDGTLRLLSIIAEVLFSKGVTLFDEIENGFNPHIIKKLVSLLYSSTSQLIITTHSPEILQYIPESEEKNSIKLLYRKHDATTGITDFFSLKEPSEKLKILSPGEAYLDVDLESISNELGKAAPENI